MTIIVVFGGDYLQVSSVVRLYRQEVFGRVWQWLKFEMPETG